jgi:mRNA interferase MazF
MCANTSIPYRAGTLAQIARVVKTYVKDLGYWCDLGYGRNPWLVVSNDARNRVLSDVIAIRLTTTARELPTWVKLSAADPLVGHANADCIEQLGKEELGEYVGALSAPTMRAVDQALLVALALER